MEIEVLQNKKLSVQDYSPGNSFLVYGIKTSIFKKEFLISVTGAFISYFNADDFEVTDPRTSIFWKTFVDSDNSVEQVFPEVREKYFFENLSNDAPRENYITDEYGKLFATEYPQSSHPQAIDLEYEHWCQCPCCEKIFENLSFSGIVTCPNCFAKLNNPFFDHNKLLFSSDFNRLKQSDILENCFYFTLTHKYYRNPPVEIYRNGKAVWEGEEVIDDLKRFNK